MRQFYHKFYMHLMTDDYRGFCRHVMTIADFIHLTVMDLGI
jgi:hypothetical protein